MLAALRLQIEWGADEALQAAPLDRRTADRPASDAAPAASIAAAAAAGRGDAVTRAQLAAAAATSPAALRVALAEFDVFGLAATATTMVVADGNPAARLVLVGEAPGAEEDASGIAFSGPAGRLLDRMLASIGLDRSTVLLMLLVPWRPPGARAPNDAEVASCLPFLQRHLALLHPQRVVALGATPARTLLGRREPISKLRGRWHEALVPGLDAPLPLLPMLPPAQLLARPEQKAIAWADWRLLHRTLAQR